MEEEMVEELIPEITAREAGELLASGADVLLLDVREPVELRWARLEDKRVRYIPLSLLAQRGLAGLPPGVRDYPGRLLVLCHLGFRSAQVTAWLRQMGMSNVYNLAGGIDAYARQVDPGVGRY